MTPRHMTSRNMARSLAQLALALALAAALIAAGPTSRGGRTRLLRGIVSDASGKPVAGAFVKLKNDERRLTFMVISQDDGRFDAKICRPANTGSRASAADTKASGSAM